MKTFHHDGEQFRDLNHDGQLAPYEDWRLSPDVRTRDLLQRLNLDEKIGLILHGTVAATGGSKFELCPLPASCNASNTTFTQGEWLPPYTFTFMGA